MLAVIGPFNTFGMGGFGQRLIYWSGLVLISVPLACCLQVHFSRVMRGSVVAREAVIILLFSLIFTPIVLFWTKIVLVDLPASSPMPGDTFLYIVAICVGISAMRYGGPELMTFMRSEAGSLALAAQDTDRGTPRLARRLPHEASGQILQLSGDGHFVNVLTTGGRFDLRMRLGDAIDEMDGVDGLTVHRSHWVARNAIAGSKRERSRVVLVLITGDEVPVGPTFRPQLEEAGIL